MLLLGMDGAQRRIVQLGKLNILIHIFGGIAGIMVMFSLANVQSMALPVVSLLPSKPVVLDSAQAQETKRHEQKTPFSLIKTLQVACLPRQFFLSLQVIRPSLLPWIAPLFIAKTSVFLSLLLLPYLPKKRFRLLSCESPRAPPRREFVFF